MSPELLENLSRRLTSVERGTDTLKFFGIRDETISYTVYSKGGLTREVRIPIPLAKRL